MKLQTMVQGLKMQYYAHLHLLDITEDIQLGGAGAPQLLGPVPTLLVPKAPIAGMHHLQPGALIGDFTNLYSQGSLLIQMTQ